MRSYMGEGAAPAKARRRSEKEPDAMDAGGFNWTLMTIVGVVVLAAAIAWAALRNRVSRPTAERSEEATKRLYEAEERAHGGEADDVP